MPSLRTLALAALLAGVSSWGNAQTSPSDRSQVLRLRHQVDSLKAVIDSLTRAARTSGAPGSPTADPAVIFSTRDWAVHRTVDQMTDAPTCTGIYKHDWNFQLNADGFYISLRGRGGVQGITLR